MPRWLTRVVVGIIYHPPHANNRRMTDHILNTVDHILSRAHPNSGVAVVGNFNRLPDGQLRNYPLSLRQVVRGSTRKSALLDKIYTNMSEWYKLPNIIPQIGSSDYRAEQVVVCGVNLCTKSTWYVAKITMVKLLWYMLCGPSTGRHFTSLHPAMKRLLFSTASFSHC